MQSIEHVFLQATGLIISFIALFWKMMLCYDCYCFPDKSVWTIDFIFFGVVAKAMEKCAKKVIYGLVTGCAFFLIHHCYLTLDYFNDTLKGSLWSLMLKY